eukprot:TRINITY_DN51504_c0_g1_i1.p1 TRINITY_DN51504_c0_g1~~TRINITY_DN51504_c0_g1_i1.p1  ORF type:complete len:701 (-),score=80.84 TRINITY_DN51504_c0_g1_i1:509-2479(-)
MSNQSSCKIEDDQWSFLAFSHQQELCLQFSQDCDTDSYGDWSKWYFCAGATSVVLQICVLILCVYMTYLLFKLLGSSADFLFAPTLAELSEQMRLPQRFAGVTFLAIGNGAPDISATVAAITQGEYELSFGALTGAAMFVTAFVAGNIIMEQPNGRVRAQGATLRDISFLLFTACFWALTLQIGQVGYASVTFSLVVFGVFLFFVGFSDFWHHVLGRPLPHRLASMRLFRYDRLPEESGEIDEETSLIMRPLISREEAMRQEAQQLQMTEAEADLADLHRAYREQRQAKGRRGLEMLAGDGQQNESEQNLEGAYNDPYNDEQEMQTSAPSQQINQDYYNDAEAMDGLPEQDGRDDNFTQMEQMQLEATEIVSYDNWWWWHLREMVETIAEENYMEIGDQNLFVKIFMVSVFPIYFLQRVTVPVITKENYQPEWLAVSLVFAFAFLLKWNPIGVQVEMWYYGVAIGMGAVISISFYFTLLRGTKKPPLQNFVHYAVWIFVSLTGFVTAVAWIDILANELVAIFALGGQLLGWPQALMGSTLLALGNSIGDYNTNHSMARSGKVSMAITACFAGPLFNILIGLSLGFMLYIIAENHKVQVSLPKVGLISVIFLLINGVLVIIASLLNHYKIPKRFGYVMMGLYAVYCVTQFPVAFLWN